MKVWVPRFSDPSYLWISNLNADFSSHQQSSFPYPILNSVERLRVLVWDGTAMALHRLLQIIFSFCCKPVKHKDALSTKMFLEFRKPGPCCRVAHSRWKREQTRGDTDTFSTKYNEDDGDIMPQQQGKALMVFACYMSMLLIPQVQCPQLLLSMYVLFI